MGIKLVSRRSAASTVRTLQARNAMPQMIRP
jgi:hypothetical protein